MPRSRPVYALRAADEAEAFVDGLIRVLDARSDNPQRKRAIISSDELGFRTSLAYSGVNALPYLRAGGKCDLWRNAEAGAEHTLRGGNIADLGDGDLALDVQVAGHKAYTNLFIYALADVVERCGIVCLDGEAVRVHNRKLDVGVRREQLLLAVVDALEVVQEFNC